jgi:ABC-type multidrug transport system permease subunit
MEAGGPGVSRVRLWFAKTEDKTQGLASLHSVIFMFVCGASFETFLYLELPLSFACLC